MTAAGLQATYDSGMQVTAATGRAPASQGRRRQCGDRHYCISAVRRRALGARRRPGRHGRRRQRRRRLLRRPLPVATVARLLHCRGRGRPRPLFLPRLRARIPRFREARAAGPADRRAMNATLSTRQIRLVGLARAGRRRSPAATWSSRSTSRRRPTTASTTPAVTTPRTTTPTRARRTRTRTPAQARHARAAGPGRPRARRSTRVVVVALVTIRAARTTSSTAPRRRRARPRRAPAYVAVDVFDQRPGTAILRKLGVVNTPVVLVVKRPGHSSPSSRASSTATWSSRPSPTRADETGRPPSRQPSPSRGSSSSAARAGTGVPS